MGAEIDDILRLVETAISEQRAPDAEQLARAALARDARHPRALHLLGVALLAMRRLDEAETVLRRGLEIEPASEALLLELGRVLIVRGDAKNAETAFATALVNAPHSRRARHGLGRLFCIRGKSSARPRASGRLWRCTRATFKRDSTWRIVSYGSANPTMPSPPSAP